MRVADEFVDCALRAMNLLRHGVKIRAKHGLRSARRVALGAYQAGVYQAPHEARIKPDWVIGTSIGAINASLIAGNADAIGWTICENFGDAFDVPSLQILAGRGEGCSMPHQIG